MKRFFVFFVLITAFLAGCCSHHQQFDISGTYKKNLIKHLENSTISLLSKDSETEEYRMICAGVWISSIKFITARHCVESEVETIENTILGEPTDLTKLPGVIMAYKTHDEMNSTFHIGKNPKPHFAVIMAYDPKNDLALLESIDVVDHDIVPIYGGEIWDGQDLHVVGHPHGLEYSYIPGTITSSVRIRNPFGEEWKLLQITASIFGGNSGGGAFDMNGALVGICSYQTTYDGAPINSLSFFVHRDVIVEFLKKEGSL